MNISFLKIISGIFILLFLFAVVPWVSDILKGKGSNEIEKENVSVNLGVFSENSIKRITIKNAESDALVFDHYDTVWKIGESEIDKEKITSFFQSFSNLTIREMVSKNENNFKKFGVTKEEGIHLSILGKNDQESVFYVGKIGSIPQEFFIRKEGIKNVYSVSGTLRELLSKDVVFWKAPVEDANKKASPDEQNEKNLNLTPSKKSVK